MTTDVQIRKPLGGTLTAIRSDPRTALAGIVALAAAVRLAAIGSSLHVDDAYSWLVASQPSPHAFLGQLAASENTPPLFYLLLSPLPLEHPAWLRLPSVLAGTLLCVVVYVALRRRIGASAALLAALAVAVAPFLVTDSDLARGFMVEDLALLVALWAVLQLADGASRRWVGVFLLASVCALYTEYSAAILLVALTISALWLGRPRRRTLLITSGLALATMIPWIPQIVRGQNQVGLTKIAPPYAGFSLGGLRNAILVLVLGERGGTASPAARWLVFAAIVALIAGGVWLLHRGWSRRSASGQYAITLIAATSLLTLLGHAIAPALGIDVFSQRYMTILIPLVAVLAAAAIDELPGRVPYRVAVAGLLILGIASFARRLGAEFEPSFQPVREAAAAAHPRSVLTNTPIVLYYLRSLRPQFDRPSNMGPGLSNTCARPCLVIDDLRAHGGTPRAATGTHTVIGPYLLTLER